jgi:LuxR family transcriptional regulator, maltose regulon positive regulatory protein
MSRLPAVRDGVLHLGQYEAPIQVGAPQWFDWLCEARSFIFAGAAGTFTARHEERSGRHFWYAYRQQDRALRKAYLGRSADLTPQRLEQAAFALAQAGDKRVPSASWDEQMSPLITTKIALPQSGMPLIARPDVVARCLESIERPGAIIAAPAGFGKTTLLLMACEQLRERGWRIAWLSLEETEQDPVRFWTYVLAALDSAQPEISSSARRLLGTPRPLPIDVVLTALVNDLAAATRPIVLVLDDYHRCATPAHDQSLAFLVEHAPATLHLVVSARSDSTFPPARLRAQGRIAALHATDLRFSAEEAGRFMRETMHLTLPAEQLARLSEQTEGWVAGLQLAALSLREQTGTLDLAADRSTTPHYVAEYLIDEVLEHQPTDIQMFLLQTATLERLAGPLCDAVTGRDDSAAVLAQLMRAQLFVTPLNPERTWYRYHHLFAGVLRERLERTEPDVLAQCHLRAAEWLREHDMIDEAIRHLIAAKALDEAATLIESESDRLVLRGEVVGLASWASALPRDVVLRHPHLCTLFIIELLLQSEGPEAAAWTDDLECSLKEQEIASDQVEGEIAVVRAFLRLFSGDFAGGAALARDAIMRLGPKDHLLRGLALWLITMFGVVGEDDLSEVGQKITEIAEESIHTWNILVMVMAFVTRAAIETYQGRLHTAAQTCHEALRLARQTQGNELPIMAIIYCVLAEVRREWNDLDGAESDINHAKEIGLYPNYSEFINDGLVSLALIQAERGHGDEALATCEEIRHAIRTQRMASIDLLQMEVVRVQILLMHGRVAEAIRWAAERKQRRKERDPMMEMLVLRVDEDLALARVALAQGNFGDVIATLEDLCARAGRAGRFHNVLDARMLLARARWMAGDLDAALRDLDASLALAAPEGFKRIYLDEGEPMADLLAGYVANRGPSPERAHALKLLAAFGRAVDPPMHTPAITLSPRELEVLRLLATGRSNEAIASELVVALSTVKWHVAQIYRKLGVRGRVQAIARARDLQLFT